MVDRKNEESATMQRKSLYGAYSTILIVVVVARFGSVTKREKTRCCGDGCDGEVMVLSCVCSAYFFD